MDSKEIFKDKKEQIPINKIKSIYESSLINTYIPLKPIEFNIPKQKPVMMLPDEEYYKMADEQRSKLILHASEHTDKEESVSKLIENAQAEKKEESNQELKNDIKEEIPVNLQKKEESAQQKKLNIAKYLDEAKECRNTAKNTSVQLSEAINYAQLYREAKENEVNGSPSQMSARQKLRMLNDAIAKADQFLRMTKGFGSSKSKDNLNAKPSVKLREAAKQLRVQLFLEKMSVFEQIEAEEKAREKEQRNIEEHNLYKIQLEADAKKQIYEDMSKKTEKESSDISKNKKAENMDLRKNLQHVEENNREISMFNQKIKDSIKESKKLQEGIASRYSLRHKQFERNEDYRQRMGIEAVKLRPMVIKDCMDDNMEMLVKYGKQLSELFTKNGLDSKKIENSGFDMKGLGELFKAELTSDDKLDAAAAGYKSYFDKLAQIINANPAGAGVITEEMKNLIAAQLVLFEKRELLKSEYSKAVDERDKLNGGKTNRDISEEPKAEKLKMEEDSTEKEKSAKKTGMQESSPADLEKQRVLGTVYDGMKKIMNNGKQDFEKIFTPMRMYLNQYKTGDVSQKQIDELRIMINNFIASEINENPELEKEKDAMLKMTAQLTAVEMNNIFNIIANEWEEIRNLTALKKASEGSEVKESGFKKKEPNVSGTEKIEEAIKKDAQSEEALRKTQSQGTGSVKQELETEKRKTTPQIIAESVDEMKSEIKDKKQAAANGKDGQDDDSLIEELKSKINEKINAEEQKAERQSQSDQTTVLDEKKKDDLKKIDLEFQRSNNEYGLQGMASEEREKEIKKQQEEKLKESKKAQEESEG